MQKLGGESLKLFLSFLFVRYSQLMLVHQRANGWMSLVQSALEFLIDHGLVSASHDLCQVATVHSWVGQGRDSDALLQDLSGIWLQQQQDNSLDSKLDVEGTSELNDSMLSSPPDPTLNLGSALDLSEDVSDVGSSCLFDSADVVHPPRSITSWTVKPSTAEEKAIYQVNTRFFHQIFCWFHENMLQFFVVSCPSSNEKYLCSFSGTRTPEVLPTA